MNEHQHHPHHPRLTDDAIDALRLHGRAELLEEIMNQPVRENSAIRPTRPADRPSRRARWLAPLAAAAVVAGLATIPLWAGGSDDGDAGGGAGVAAQPSTGVAAGQVTGIHGVLLADGWTVDNLSSSVYGDSLSYTKGSQDFEITRYPASAYDGYVDDRAEVEAVDTIDLLGTSSTVRAYSRDDHEVLRAPEDDSFVELRGEGMDLAGFKQLAGQVALLDDAGYASTLPDSVVTPDELDATMTDMLADIDTPPGFDLDEVDVTGFNDRYQVGAPLTGAVTCGWVDVYASGDADDVQAATTAMSGSRQWAILQEMAEEGDWSSAVWAVGRQMDNGASAQRIRSLFGCA